MKNIHQFIEETTPSGQLRIQARHAMQVEEDSDKHDRLMAEADALEAAAKAQPRTEQERLSDEAHAAYQRGDLDEERRLLNQARNLENAEQQAKVEGQLSPCGWTLKDTQHNRKIFNAAAQRVAGRGIAPAQALPHIEKETGLKGADVKVSVEFFKTLGVMN